MCLYIVHDLVPNLDVSLQNENSMSKVLAYSFSLGYGMKT